MLTQQSRDADAGNAGQCEVADCGDRARHNCHCDRWVRWQDCAERQYQSEVTRTGPSGEDDRDQTGGPGQCVSADGRREKCADALRAEGRREHGYMQS